MNSFFFVLFFTYRLARKSDNIWTIFPRDLIGILIAPEQSTYLGVTYLAALRDQKVRLAAKDFPFQEHRFPTRIFLGGT